MHLIPSFLIVIHFMLHTLLHSIHYYDLNTVTSPLTHLNFLLHILEIVLIITIWKLNHLQCIFEFCKEIVTSPFSRIAKTRTKIRRAIFGVSFSKMNMPHHTIRHVIMFINIIKILCPNKSVEKIENSMR